MGWKLTQDVGHSLLYLSDPIVFHLNHMQGVVGPASFLIKLNVARQSFKTDLKYTNTMETANWSASHAVVIQQQ